MFVAGFALATLGLVPAGNWRYCEEHLQRLEALGLLMLVAVAAIAFLVAIMMIGQHTA